MHGQITTSEDCKSALKTQLDDAQLALKKLGDEWCRAEGDICAEKVAAEEFLDAERPRVERLERELAAELEKVQQLL